MEQIYERVAGCDVHRDQVTVCVRTPGPRGGVHKDKARFKTTTAGLIEMADWCGERAVELVAMEATGVYLDQVSGRYFANSKPKRSSKASYDQAVAARLWQVSAELVNLTATA
jgi:transposase